jgi:PAS domain S-box-containing protein
MTPIPLHALLVEDSEDDASLLLDALRRGGYAPVWQRVETEPALRAALATTEWDIVFLDYTLPHFDAPNALRVLRESGSDLPAIVVSGIVGEDVAVEALKLGANDYLLKGNLRRLIPAVQRELREAELRRASRAAEETKRRAEIVLRLSEERHRLLFEFNPMPMWVFAAEDLRFLTVNEAAIALYGYTREEFLAMTVPEIQTGEDLTPLCETTARQGLDAPPVRGPAQHRRKDGSAIAVEVVSQPIVFDGHVARIVLAIDVTARQLAEQKLEESERRLRRAQRIAHLGHWEREFSEGRLFWSDEVVEMFGLCREELTGRVEDFYRAIHPDDRQRVAQINAEAHRTGGFTDFEHRIVRPDGEVRHLHIRAEVTLDENGRPLRQAGTVQDITERKRVEAELARIKLAVEYASDAIQILDREGRAIYHNRAFSDLLGYTPGQLNAAGGPRVLFANHDIAEEVLGAVDRTGSWTGPASLHLRRDKVAELYLRANAVKDDRGDIVATIIVGTDLSEQKRAERKIAEQAALLDQAQDAILVQDLAGCVRYWNKSAERVFGWAAHEVMGQRAQDFLYEDPENYDVAIAAVLRQGDWTGEMTKRRKDGSQVLVEGRWTLLRDQFGEARSILAINADITEKKKLEAQFSRAQRMESIGTLAGGIAHDLNNVLGPIIMAIDLFKLKITDPADLNLLEIVETSARRGADMVKQVLSFARGIDGERLLIKPGQLLRDVRKIVGETFPKNVTMTTGLADGIWHVVGDPMQLHQVLINLCVNARDAMLAQGGTIAISVRNLRVDAQFATMSPDAHPGAYVVFEVADTGSGMSSEVAGKIFEPFFTTKEVGKGTGLGLATTLAIVKSHGGFITFESEPGRGATFKIHLPADEKSAAPSAQAKPCELPPGRGELVLVIDDEASVRRITAQTLETFGYKVITASDGADGVAKYAQHPGEIDAVITDMMMPVMDGAATIRALMRIDPQVRIIAASGLSTKGTEAESAGEGVKHFLPKPYTADTVLKALRELLHPGES